MKLLKKIITTSLTCLSLSTFAHSAFASNPNQFNYFGLSYQSNSYDEINFHPQIDTTQLSPMKYNESTSDNGWKAFFGHQFNRYIAIETGLTSFGKASFTVTEEQDSNNKVNTLFNGEFKTLAGDIRVVGTYPVTEHLFLKAQVGALVWDNDFTFLSNSTGVPAVEKTSDTGVSLLTGLGIAYGFNNAVAISLDYELTEIAEIKTKTLALSILFRF